MAEFLFSEAGAKDVSVFEKDFTIDVLLHKKLRKAKKIYNADADADAKMLMPKFPNDHFRLMFFMGQKQTPEVFCKKGCS